MVPEDKGSKALSVNTCQVGQRFKGHLLVIIEKHLDLPHANPQVRFIEFIGDVPTCERQRRITDFGAESS